MRKNKITKKEFKIFYAKYNYDLDMLVEDIEIENIADKKLKELLNTYIDCQVELSDAECGLMWAEDELNKYFKRKK